MLGVFAGHLRWGGAEGTGLDLSRHQFQHRAYWERLVVIMNWEGERGLG
jgi:homoserine trans-succinylase